VLLQLAYLGVTNVFALLRLLPMSDRDKDVEILALHHQIAVPKRQLGKTRPRFWPSDQGRAERGPDAQNAFGHGTLGADVPARDPRPHAHLEPAPAAALAAGVRVWNDTRTGKLDLFAATIRL